MSDDWQQPRPQDVAPRYAQEQTKYFKRISVGRRAQRQTDSRSKQSAHF